MSRIRRAFVWFIQHSTTVDRIRLSTGCIVPVFLFGAATFSPLGSAIGLSEGWSFLFGGVLLLSLIGGSLLAGMYRANVNPRTVLQQLAQTFPPYEVPEDKKIPLFRGWRSALYILLAGLVLPVIVATLIPSLIEVMMQQSLSREWKDGIGFVCLAVIGLPSAIATYRYLKRRNPGDF